MKPGKNIDHQYDVVESALRINGFEVSATHLVIYNFSLSVLLSDIVQFKIQPTSLDISLSSFAINESGEKVFKERYMGWLLTNLTKLNLIFNIVSQVELKRASCFFKEMIRQAPKLK